MSYERSLTFNLRMRGLSEDEIADTLQDVRAHEAASGAPAEAEFGAAEAYAKQFPKKKRRTRGTTITAVAVVLAVVYLLVALLLWALGGIDVREFIGPLRLLPAVALVLLGALAGFLTDYFQPAPRASAVR